MRRVPEPELMNDPDQAQAYAEADFSEAHDAFVAHFAQRFPAFRAGRVLDLGCGPADVTLRFARAYPDTSIVGIDGASAMLDLARAAITQAGFASRIELCEACLPHTDIEVNAFDAVISNSLLHHLHEPQVLWQTLRQAAKPGAPICVMDLLRPDTLKAARALQMRYAAEAPEILRRDFYNSLCAAFEVEEVREQLSRSGFIQLQVEAVSDRHLLIWGCA